ncbi:MAG: molybdopterin-synthase adenylyltransferase MoeB [Kiritimatiellia bacterium]
MNDLSSHEILRYQRHLTLPGFGMQAQRKLQRARVLVIGAGGLGCPALQYLAAAGTGTLGIVDDDRVSLSNLQRQILYTEADIGTLKAETAAARLSAMNPGITCKPHSRRLTPENALELINAYDLVIDGSDNFATRYLVNDACVLAGKPLIYGAIQTYQGQASVFNYQGGPTYRCLFPDPPDPKDAPNCTEIGVLGVLPGMIGMIQATEAIKVLAGIGVPLSGVLLIYDALQMRMQRVHIQRVPDAANVTTLATMTYACGSSTREPEDEMTAESLQNKLVSGVPLQVIDVREDWERSICQIPSVQVPLEPLLNGQLDLAPLELQPERPTCVYCKAGMRSLRALMILRNHYGFRDIKSLQGGILAWAQRIDHEMQTY